MAVDRDAARRAQREARFLEGIRRFSAFLVEAAKRAPADVQFEREPAKAARRPAGRAAKAKGAASAAKAPPAGKKPR